MNVLLLANDGALGVPTRAAADRMRAGAIMPGAFGGASHPARSGCPIRRRHRIPRSFRHRHTVTVTLDHRGAARLRFERSTMRRLPVIGSIELAFVKPRTDHAQPGTTGKARNPK